MERSLRVHLMGRELTLRVSPEDEPLVTAAAALAEERLQAFRQAFPSQPELTAALIVTLEMAQELLAAKQERTDYDLRLSDALVALDLELAASLVREAGTAEEQP